MQTINLTDTQATLLRAALKNFDGWLGNRSTTAAEDAELDKLRRQLAR